MKKVVSGMLLTMLLVGMLASVLNIQSVVSVEDNWWNSDWMYRRQVNVTENSGYSLVNFPVEVSFRHDGHAQPDGKDIRVVDGSVEIPSYVEKCNSTYAKIVFEINLTALETKTIYIYYGNPNATVPNYPLVPLTISEGNNGYAIIDNSVYIGWHYTSWGWSNNVELWDDFRIDFNSNKDPTDDSDLIRDYGSRHGGIGRHRRDIEAIGLGEYQGYVQTPIYIEVTFANATLKVYRNNPWVKTTQADFLFMFSPSYDYANYGTAGSEQNIVDGNSVNQIMPSPPWHYPWNEMYLSPVNPKWMAYRDSIAGEIFGSIGLNIGTIYNYYFAAKEGPDWDRCIFYDFGTPDLPLEPYDQPLDCRIYWYGDNTNGYSNIETMATILGNLPSVTIGDEETLSLAITCTVSIDPDTLNLRSKGKWITAYIELPEGYDVNDINTTTIMLNNTIQAELIPAAIGDYDEDGISDLMVKFDRTAVASYIIANVNLTQLYEERFMTVTLTLTGYLNDGTPFQGNTTIKIIMPMPRGIGRHIFPL